MKSIVKVLAVAFMLLAVSFNANAQFGGILRGVSSAARAAKNVSEEKKAAQREKEAAALFQKAQDAMAANDMEYLMSKECEDALKGSKYESQVWDYLKKESCLGNTDYLGSMNTLVKKAKAAKKDTVMAFYVNAAMNAYNTMSRAEGVDIEGNMTAIEKYYNEITELYWQVPDPIRNVEWRGNEALKDPRYLFILHSPIPEPDKLPAIAQQAQVAREEAARKAEQQRIAAEERRKQEEAEAAKLKEEMAKNQPHMTTSSGNFTDVKGNVIGSVSSDGEFRLSGSTALKMKSNGEIYDKWGKLVGMMDKDGYIWKFNNNSWSGKVKLGQVDYSGNVYNSSNQRVGSVNVGVKDSGGHDMAGSMPYGVDKHYTAIFYFFLDKF